MILPRLDSPAIVGWHNIRVIAQNYGAYLAPFDEQKYNIGHDSKARGSQTRQTRVESGAVRAGWRYPAILHTPKGNSSMPSGEKNGRKMGIMRIKHDVPVHCRVTWLC